MGWWGHRFDYASNLQFGVSFDKIRLGYIYEFPSTRSYLLPGQTHEFVLVYHLFKKDSNPSENDLNMW